MGMYDSIYHSLTCPHCRQTKVREVQTKEFSNLLNRYVLGDFVEPSRFGYYVLEETWYCRNCDPDYAKPNTCYIELLHGMIIGVSGERPKEVKKVDIPIWLWEIVKENQRVYKEKANLLQRVMNMLSTFVEKKQEAFVPGFHWWYEVDNWQEFREKLLRELKEDLEKIEEQFHGGEDGSGSVSEE